MKTITKVYQWIVRLFKGDFANQIIDALNGVHPYLETAYQIVSVLAAITPTPVDDAVIAFIAKWNLIGLLNPASLDPNASQARHDLAFAAIRKAVPTLSDSQINLLIELAYNAFKQK